MSVVGNGPVTPSNNILLCLGDEENKSGLLVVDGRYKTIESIHF
jgi:hypothetical protein